MADQTDLRTDQSGKRYKTVSQLNTAEDFCNLQATQARRRTRQEIDWRLNLAYFRGNQYVYWNPSAKRIESVPTEDGEKPRYRVRIIANQIGPGSQSLISKIIKTKPIFGATPGQVGDKAVKAAEFSETLLEAWWRDMDLGGKYEDAVQWSIQAGTGYWWIDWDAFANKSMRFLLDPTGQPITDEAVESEFRAQLEEQGVEPQEKVVYLGDLKVDVMSPFHVWGDPTQKDPRDWKWVITQHNLDPDDLYARYKVTAMPDAVSANPDQTLPMGNAENAGEKNVVKVYRFSHVPTPSQPNGRIVTWIESGGKRILEDKKWPWPEMTRLPLVAFKGINVPGQAEGDAVTTHARSIQKQLNRVLSQITEFFNLSVKPQWMVPTGALNKTRLTNEPGAAFQYNPVAQASGGSLKPEQVEVPGLPQWVFEFLNTITQQLRDIYGLTEVTEGQLPPNLEAADAIDLLQEMATDRFAPAIEANERSLARAGQIMLELAQCYYTEPRLLQIRGFGGAGSVKQFTRADFGGDITVHVEAGSSLPKTRAARRKQVEKWIEMGLLDPKKAWRYYDLADIKDIAVEFAMDEDHALREHEKIIAGIPINMEAVQSAQQALQQGINPETGQPLVDPQTGQPTADPNEILLKASLQPQLSDNIEMHLDKHRKYIVAAEFDSHSPDVQHRFRTHYELTIEMMRSMPQVAPQVDAPRINVQVREAVGPTTMSEILKRAGIPEADPQVIATEPPLETQIINQVDQPDADAEGPGREGAHLAPMAAQMVQAHIANSEAQLQNAQSQAVHEQKQGQDAELHAHAVRKAKAEADLAERKARETSFKPPTGAGAGNKPSARNSKKPSPTRR